MRERLRQDFTSQARLASLLDALLPWESSATLQSAPTSLPWEDSCDFPLGVPEYRTQTQLVHHCRDLQTGCPPSSESSD